ncbi:MAG: gamma-glutamyltransferase family protein [Proteobacteria bacterium]|nr:gamma-glutamyltransferase family protein [Pseudomonadota bacterium]
MPNKPVLDSRSGSALPTMPALRPSLLGTRHMVVAGHYLAAHAGFAILEAGGNAIDAGVAAGIALGVVHSDLVGFAGVAPIIVYLAERNEVQTISGLGTWPRAIRTDQFVKTGEIPVGVLRTVVPAAPDAWITALEKYGTMSFGDVAAAAIRFASEGFTMYPLMAEIISANQEGYRRWPENERIYLPQGRPPQAGELFVQSDLGRTLQYMADEEKAAAGGGRSAGLAAARAAFYTGDIAGAIVRHQKENGGLLDAEDMAAFHVAIEPPVSIDFNGTTVYACGPWCQGPALLQTLKLLDGIDLAALGHNSAAYVHTVIEALKLAFADRHHHYGDPRFIDVPIDALLSNDYADIRRQLIRDDTAWPELPPAGDPRGLRAILGDGIAQAAAAEPIAASLDTSYACAIDKHGNIFSATPSDVSSSAPVVPGTGLVPSTRGSQSWTDPSHPSSVAPGKRPRLTPNPALAIRPGEYAMPFGTPGGDIQIQAMTQAFLNVAVFGMNPQAAVEAPRFATYSFPDSFEPHTYHPGRMNIESRIDGAVNEQLSALGHKVESWPNWTWRAGAMCMIQSDLTRPLLASGADPRRPAYAVGW